MKNIYKTVGKDLKNQTQFTGIAAAKANKLELGVLGKGFSIKQAQSMGKTSVVEAEGDFKHPLTGKAWNAFAGFLAPFKQSGNWVDDARGQSVCDARSAAVAKEIVKVLNEKYPKKESK